jgi:VWFA-related protein
MRQILAFLCIAGVLAAQTPPAPQKDASDKPLESITIKNVLVPVTVSDAHGNFLPGLTPYDFRLFDNEKLQKITQDMASHPLSVVLAIQANADVEAILPAIKRLSSVFESMVVGEDGEVAVLAFDHRVQTLTGFTSDPAQIDQAFAKLHAGSYTAALNDATMQGIRMLQNRPVERRRVLIQMSENRDKGSELKNVREILTQADFANVAMYSVNISQLIASMTSKAQPNRPSAIPPEAQMVPTGPNSGVMTTTTISQNDMGNWVPAIKDVFDLAKSVFVPNPLDVYTKYTGGKEFSFKNQKTLDKDIQSIGDELHSQYLLAYQPNNPDEGGYHKITVEILKPGYKVRTRDGYWQAGKPQ